MTKRLQHRARLIIAAATAAMVLAPTLPAHAASERSTERRAIDRVVRQTLEDEHLRAVIVRVTERGKPVMTRAYGTSLPGVPATTDMRFRNGAVAFAYVATLLMRYVDRGLVGLDDPVHRWLPGLPHSRAVTLKMLANQTSGYPDYETDETFSRIFYRDPFQPMGYARRLRIAVSRPQLFPPGTNWSYSHTNFMVLGRILSMVGDAPLSRLLRREVLRPMGLRDTLATQTGQIPDPVLHAFSAERRTFLGIPDGRPFIEESSFWSSAWGTPVGATQTTTIRDLTRTITNVGEGTLLSRRSFRAMTGPHLLGFGERRDNCAPSCFTQVRGYNYGLGIVRSGAWLLQNPMLGGYAATTAYLRRKRIAVAVAVTFGRGAFSPQGDYSNASDALFRRIGAVMAPGEPPPVKK